MSPKNTQRQYATQIIVGLSTREDAKALVQSVSGHTWIVEPDPERAASLRTQLEDMANGYVVETWPSHTTDGIELSEFNLPGIRSFHEPNQKFRETFPGLSVQKRLDVDTISPQALVAHIGDLIRPIKMAVEMPGSELELLKLWPEDSEHYPDVIQVRCCSEPFFDGSADVASIREWAKSKGFDVHEEADIEPEWTTLVIEVSALARELGSTKLALRKATEALQSSEELIVQIKAELAARNSEIAALNEANEAHEVKSREFEHRLEAARNDVFRAEGQVRLVADLLRGERI